MIFLQVRLERQAGGAQAISDAAKLLSDAKFPVILSGAGVVIGGAIDDCVKLAEKLGRTCMLRVSTQ